MMLSNFNENTAGYNSNNHADDTSHKDPSTVLPQRPSAVQSIEPIRSAKPAAATPHLPPTAPHSWGPYPAHQLDGFLNGCYPTGNPHRPVYTGVDQYKTNTGKYHTAPPHAHPMQHDYHHYATQYPGGTIHHPIPVKCNEVCCQHLPDPPRYHPTPPTFQFPPHHIQPPRYSDYHHHHHHHHNATNGISKQYLYNNNKKTNKPTSSSGSSQSSNSSFSPVHSDLQGLPKYSHHHYHQVGGTRQKEMKQPAKPVALDTSAYPVYPVMNSYWASRGWVPPPPPYHQAVPLAQYKTKQDSSGAIHCTPAFQSVEHSVPPTGGINEERKGVIMSGSNSNNSNANNNGVLGSGIPKTVNDYHEKSTTYRTDCFDLSTSFINSGFPPIVHNSTNKITINNITTAPLRPSTHSQPRNINVPCQLMDIDKQQLPGVQSELQVNVNETSNLAPLETPPATHCINVLSSSPNGNNFMINESTHCNPINYSISNSEMFNNITTISENVKNYKSQSDSVSGHLTPNMNNPDGSHRLPKKQQDLDVRQFLVTWNDTDEDSTRMSESQNNSHHNPTVSDTVTAVNSNTNSVNDDRLSISVTQTCSSAVKNNALWSNSPAPGRQHPPQPLCKNQGPVMNVMDASPIENPNNYGISNKIFSKKLHPDGEVCISAIPKQATPLDNRSNIHHSYMEGYGDPKLNADEKKSFLQNNICRNTNRVLHDSCVDKTTHFSFYNGFGNFIREKNDSNIIENAPFYSAFNEPSSQHSCPAIRQHLASWEHINNTINETDHSPVTIDRKIISTNMQKDGFERKSNVNVVEPIIPISSRNSLIYDKEAEMNDKRRSYTNLSTLDESVGNFYNDSTMNSLHQRSILDNGCNFIDLSNNTSNISHNLGCNDMHNNIQQSYPHNRPYVGYKTGVICENNPNKCTISPEVPKFHDASVLRIPQHVAVQDNSGNALPSVDSINDPVPSKEPSFTNSFVPTSEVHKNNYNETESMISVDSPFTCPDGSSEVIPNSNVRHSHIVDPVLQESTAPISSPLSVGSHCNNSNHSNFTDIPRKTDQKTIEHNDTYTSFLHGIPASDESLLNAYTTEDKCDKGSEKDNNTITLHSANDITTHITVNDCSPYVQQYSEMEESLADKILKSNSGNIDSFNAETSQTLCENKRTIDCNAVATSSTMNGNNADLLKDDSRKSIRNDDNNNSNIIKMKLSNRIIKKKFTSAGLKLKLLSNNKEWTKLAHSSCNDLKDTCNPHMSKSREEVSLIDNSKTVVPDLSSERRHMTRVLSMPSLEDSPSQIDNNHASEIGEEIEGLIAAEQNNSRHSLDCSVGSVDKELEKPFLSIGQPDDSNSLQMVAKENGKNQTVTQLSDLSSCQLTQNLSKRQFGNKPETHILGICSNGTDPKVIDNINILQNDLSVSSLDVPLKSCYSSGLSDKVNLDIDICNKNKPEAASCPSIDYPKTAETNCSDFSEDRDSNSKSNLKYCNSPSISYFKLNKNNSVESHHCDNDEVDEADYDEERLISSVECTPGSPNVEELFEDINKPRDDFSKANFNLELKEDDKTNVDGFHSKPHCDLISNACLKINHDCKINNKESVIKSTLNTIENNLVEDDYGSSTFHCDDSSLAYNKCYDSINSIDDCHVNAPSLFKSDVQTKVCTSLIDNVTDVPVNNGNSKDVFSNVLLPQNEIKATDDNISAEYVKSTSAEDITDNNSVVTESNKEVDSTFDIDSLCDINLTQSHYIKPDNKDRIEDKTSNIEHDFLDRPDFPSVSNDLNTAIDLSKEIEKSDAHMIENSNNNKETDSDKCNFQVTNECVSGTEETERNERLADITSSQIFNNGKSNDNEKANVCSFDVKENGIVSDLMPDLNCNSEEGDDSNHVTENQENIVPKDLTQKELPEQIMTDVIDELKSHDIVKDDNTNNKINDEGEELSKFDETRVQVSESAEDNLLEHVGAEIGNRISLVDKEDHVFDQTVENVHSDFSEISSSKHKENLTSNSQDSVSSFVDETPSGCRNIIVNNFSVTRETVIHDDSIKINVDCGNSCINPLSGTVQAKLDSTNDRTDVVSLSNAPQSDDVMSKSSKCDVLLLNNSDTGFETITEKVLQDETEELLTNETLSDRFENKSTVISKTQDFENSLNVDETDDNLPISEPDKSNLDDISDCSKLELLKSGLDSSYNSGNDSGNASMDFSLNSGDENQDNDLEKELSSSFLQSEINSKKLTSNILKEIPLTLKSVSPNVEVPICESGNMIKATSFGVSVLPKTSKSENNQICTNISDDLLSNQSTESMDGLNIKIDNKDEKEKEIINNESNSNVLSELHSSCISDHKAVEDSESVMSNYSTQSLRNNEERIEILTGSIMKSETDGGLAVSQKENLNNDFNKPKHILNEDQQDESPSDEINNCKESSEYGEAEQETSLNRDEVIPLTSLTSNVHITNLQDQYDLKNDSNSNKDKEERVEEKSDNYQSSKYENSPQFILHSEEDTVIADRDMIIGKDENLKVKIENNESLQEANNSSNEVCDKEVVEEKVDQSSKYSPHHEIIPQFILRSEEDTVITDRKMITSKDENINVENNIESLHQLNNSSNQLSELELKTSQDIGLISCNDMHKAMNSEEERDYITTENNLIDNVDSKNCSVDNIDYEEQVPQHIINVDEGVIKSNKILECNACIDEKYRSFDLLKSKMIHEGHKDVSNGDCSRKTCRNKYLKRKWCKSRNYRVRNKMHSKIFLFKQYTSLLKRRRSRKCFITRTKKCCNKCHEKLNCKLSLHLCVPNQESKFIKNNKKRKVTFKRSSIGLEESGNMVNVIKPVHEILQENEESTCIPNEILLKSDNCDNTICDVDTTDATIVSNECHFCEDEVNRSDPCKVIRHSDLEVRCESDSETESESSVCSSKSIVEQEQCSQLIDQHVGMNHINVPASQEFSNGIATNVIQNNADANPMVLFSTDDANSTLCVDDERAIIEAPCSPSRITIKRKHTSQEIGECDSEELRTEENNKKRKGTNIVSNEILSPETMKSISPDVQYSCIVTPATNPDVYKPNEKEETFENSKTALENVNDTNEPEACVSTKYTDTCNEELPLKDSISNNYKVDEIEDKCLSPENIISNCSDSTKSTVENISKLITFTTFSDDIKESTKEFIGDVNDDVHLNISLNNHDVLSENESLAISDIIDYSRMIENNFRNDEHFESTSPDITYSNESKPLPAINVDDSNRIVIIIEELCNSESKLEESNVKKYDNIDIPVESDDIEVVKEESYACQSINKLTSANMYEEKQFVTDVLDEFTVAEVEVTTNTCESIRNYSDDSSDEEFLGYSSYRDDEMLSASPSSVCKNVCSELPAHSIKSDVSEDINSVKNNEPVFKHEIAVDKENDRCYSNMELDECKIPILKDDKTDVKIKQTCNGVDSDEKRVDIISISPTTKTDNKSNLASNGKLVIPVIKCSLPWERVFNTTHSKKRKSSRKSHRRVRHGIELGPAKIELRVSSSEQCDESSGIETSWKVVDSSPLPVNSSLSISPVVKVKRLILQRDPELTSYSEDSACSSKEYLSSSSDEDNKDEKNEKRFSSSSSLSSSSMLFEDSNSSNSSHHIHSHRSSRSSSTCSRSSSSSVVTSASSIPKVLIKKMKQSEYKSFLKISNTFNKPVVKLIRCDLIDSLALKNETSINLCKKTVSDPTDKPVNMDSTDALLVSVDESLEGSSRNSIINDCMDAEIEKSIKCSDLESSENMVHETSSCLTKSPLSSHSKSVLENCDITLQNNEDNESALSNCETALSTSSRDLDSKIEQTSTSSGTFSRLESDISKIKFTKCSSDDTEHIASRGVATKRTSEESSDNESSIKRRSPRDVSKYMFHCQRCLLVFNNKEEVIEHQAAMHPSHQELHHCMLCQRSFSSLSRHTLHIQSRSHRRLELMQRCTIHAMHRYFTGRDCPRLYPLTPAELKSFDWRPNQPGCIHFYHHPSPLQLALQENPWGMKSKLNSERFTSSSSSSSCVSSPTVVTSSSSSAPSPVKSPLLQSLTLPHIADNNS